jgi:tetratricopeptide (TPR) repeat protein
MDIKDKIKRFVASFSSMTKEELLKIVCNLHYTLWIAFIAGFAAITGYALRLPNASLKLFSLLALLSLASFVSGFFLGFLFGIPKRSEEKESKYHLSSNLVDISDWLTKIIIGLGLVEIKGIPGALSSVGTYIQKATGTEESIKIVSVCCIIYFSIFGLYYGYNYMRLILSSQYKGADDMLLETQRQLSKTGAVLQQTKMDNPDTIDHLTKENLEKYDRLLKQSKPEADYTFNDWYYKGLNAYENKQYNNAIACLEKALEKDPKSETAPSACLKIGAAYFKLGLRERAEEVYNKIIRDYPGFNLMNYVYYNLGVTLVNLKKKKEGLEAIDKSLALDPNYSLAWYNKACLLAESKTNKTEMLKSLKRAIDLDAGLKTKALQDEDFKDFVEDKDFKKLLL